MIIDGHGEKALGLVLTDHILVQIVLYLHGLGNGLRLGLAVLATCLGSICKILLHNTVSLLSADLADIAVHTRDEQPALSFRSSAEVTYFLHHYFFLVRTLSIIP